MSAAHPPVPAPQRPGPEWIRSAPGRWWVLHTRARNEKRVAAALADGGLCHYLPLVAVRRTYAKSSVVFDLPLFPGYVFLAGGYEACDRARRTNRVANILPVADQVQFCDELMQIYRVVESGDAVQLVTGIPPGTRCRVRTGPFQGLEGVVIRQGRQCRLHLSVTILGQSAAVELDAAIVEPIGSSG